MNYIGVIEIILTIIAVAAPIVGGLITDIKAHKTLKGRISAIETTLSNNMTHLDALDKDIQLLGNLIKK